jgi:hypothetical protein
MDQALRGFLGADADAFYKAATTSSDDAKVAEYIKTFADKKSPAEIDGFNAQFLSYKPEPGSDGEKYFLELRDSVAPDRTDVTAWPDLLDLDEKREVPVRTADVHRATRSNVQNVQAWKPIWASCTPPCDEVAVAFETLAARLGRNAIPLLLCGPVLRRVTSSSVTVWLVTREAVTVTLRVMLAGNATALLTSSGVSQGKSIAVGSQLHVVCVTARGADKTLSEGNVYTYDLSFAFTKSGTKTLADAAGVAPALAEFSYGTYGAPSFVLPPADLEKLRIIHGSCRKPNGGGSDALAILDDLIAPVAGQPLGRPHQLFMTGDQIYADEVADILLFMLIDAGDTLLGWSEMLPAPPGLQAPMQAKSLAAGTRSLVIKAAGFTSDDTRSHLMGLGDYITMYLFAWSPVLWPNTLPVLADVPVPDKTQYPTLNKLFYKSDDWKASKWTKQQQCVTNYLGTLSKVRRALANIPSYMICDDHEITDDWNMTREFCDNVYGNDLGMRVMQNGLTAYALCQAWGNTPEQFEDEAQPQGRSKAAGRQLLALLDGTNATSFPSNAAAIQKIVGLHDAKTLAATATQQSIDYGPYHEAGAQFMLFGTSVNDSSLNYYYTVEADSYQVIVTDTRTCRKFPKPGAVTHPDLLGGAELSYQVDQALSLGSRLQLVIVTTNMPPIPPIRAAEDLLNIADSLVYSNDLYDSWEFPSASFDTMVLALSSRLPLDASSPPKHSGPIIVLSGDVHTSYASRLQYWADKRYGDSASGPTPAAVVFAELVASPFKNESSATLGQHNDGYKYVPHMGLGLLLPPEKPDGVYGWAVPFGSTAQVKVGTTESSNALSGGGVAESSLTVSGLKPSLDFNDMDNTHLVASSSATVTTPPDYQYRAEQIYGAALGQVATPPPLITTPGATTDAATRTAALGAFNSALGAYRNYRSTVGKGKQIVGRSNICEITFTWPTGDSKQVHQTVRWYETKTADGQDVDSSKLFWARYDVSLALNDTTNYGKLPFPPPP